MDIERINFFLAKAILEFQDDEIESMAEIVANESVENSGDFSKSFIDILGNLKRDVSSIVKVEDKTKKIGKKTVHVAHVFYKGAKRPPDVVITVQPRFVNIGGIQHYGKGRVMTAGRSPKQVYADIVSLMKGNEKPLAKKRGW